MLSRVGLVIVVLAVFAVTTPASPIQLSYVYSDSMEPTIDQHDGYVTVPVEQIDQRDIVVFWSSERDEYVTHRVVGQSDAGLITRGDNNDVTDQAAGYSHVQREEVFGQVLTVAGEPVTIGGLGILVSFMRSYRLLVFGIATVLIGGSLLYDGSRHPHPRRSLVRVSDIIHPVFIAAIIGSILIILTGAVSHELTYVAVDGGSGAPNTLTVGEATTDTIFINATSIPLTHRIVSTDGMTTTNSSRNASIVTANVYIPAPIESGAYPTSVDVYRYPAVLPRRLIEALHSIHPIVAAGSTTTLLFAPFALLYVLLFDGNTPLRPSHSWWPCRVRRLIR